MNEYEFIESWKSRPEISYIHWSSTDPKNQLQFAFRRHYETFTRLARELGVDIERSLEVGCGRGSLSAHFAEAGVRVTLLDISPEVIGQAQEAFRKNNLSGAFDIGDCRSLPYDDAQFDLVFSVGLLEHFEEVRTIISEQIRVLRPGGLFIGYVVPRYNNSITNQHSWINDILSAVLPLDAGEKQGLFRADHNSAHYIEILRERGLSNIGASGIYSVPMISNSINFPFTLLNDKAEEALVRHFKFMLSNRQLSQNSDPWLCDEGLGNAFIVWGQKS